MNIPSSVGLGLVTFALFAWGAAGGEDRGWIDDPAVLCSHGHPAKRLPTDYDGMPLRHGYARNHKTPRCLGGPDTLANLEYQPLAAARWEDVHVEWPACEAYCRNPSPELLKRLRESFK